MGLDRKIIADLDGTPYPIYVGRNVIDGVVGYVQETTRNTKILIVTDNFFKDTLARKVALLFEAQGCSVVIHALDAGKGNKTISEVLKIYSILEEENFARDSTLIAIGGGVIGDMSGFVASTWLRGMNLVHIPTTLMAMIDSSIGGKTAVNFRHTINGIGSYYHPIANLIDLNLIDSLSERDYVSGLAEVVKCGIINDVEFFNYLSGNYESIRNRSQQHIIDLSLRHLDPGNVPYTIAHEVPNGTYGIDIKQFLKKGLVLKKAVMH